MAETQFKMGDMVEWWSSYATKRGPIVAIVPSGDVPSDVGMKVNGASTPRNHESYIVVGTTIANTNLGGRTGKQDVYWPRVSALKLAKPTQALREA